MLFQGKRANGCGATHHRCLEVSRRATPLLFMLTWLSNLMTPLLTFNDRPGFRRRVRNRSHGEDASTAAARDQRSAGGKAASPIVDPLGGFQQPQEALGSERRRACCYMYVPTTVLLLLLRAHTHPLILGRGIYRGWR